MAYEEIKGKWNEMKGDLRSQWGDLTDDELERTKGNSTSIFGLLQQKYAHAKEDLQEKFDEIMAKYSDKSEVMKNRMKTDRDMNDSSRTL
jgi:uncharacterized protein YjbJ (UPF0337 family)